MALHQAHLLFLALWGGVVIAESVIELMGRRREDLIRSTTIFHYWIDILLEAPIIFMVAVTGLAMVLTLDNLGWLHVIKIGAAAAAMSANVFCILTVVRRYRELQGGADNKRLLDITQKVMLSAIVGMPLALIAIALGLFLTLKRLTFF